MLNLVIAVLCALVAGAIGGWTVAAHRGRQEREAIREAWGESEGHLRERLEWHQREIGRLEEQRDLPLETCRGIAEQRDDMLVAYTEIESTLEMWRKPHPN